MDDGTAMIPLPVEFVERMERQLRNELPDFLHALSLPPVRGIRIHPGKPFDGIEKYTKNQQVPWEKNGYLLEASSTAGGTVFHEAGAFYLQEPAAMLPAAVLDARPGEKILDLCAAPGGKTTQIAMHMEGKGLLVSNEPVPKRALILSRNVERLGIQNCIVTNAFPGVLPHSWDETFDAVLVDAPCSGEGMFRRDPESRLEWTREKASGCAERQREILQEADRFLRPGGRIVYSTCTYNPEENDKVISRFLAENPDYQAEPFVLPGVDGREGMFLCLPHRTPGEGQFVAKLRKAGNPTVPKLKVPFSAPVKQETEIIHASFPGLPLPNAKFGKTMVLVPECPDMQGVRVIRAGLHLCEIRGKNVFPDHAAAMSCLSDYPDVKEISSEEAEDYIAGKEICGQEQGWILMRYRNLILGWGKGSNGRIVNHYPKGLRKNSILIE